jgi:uncharacterized protein
MKDFTTIVPARVTLNAEELERLAGILDEYDEAMSLEEVDGFFCALICGPDPILPGEFLAEIFDGDLYAISDSVPESEAFKVAALLQRYWNGIRDGLRDGRPRRIFLFDAAAEDCDQWVNGFMTGVEMWGDAWEGLVSQGMQDLLGPFRYFDDESDPDKAGEFEAAAPEERTRLFLRMEESLPAIYGHFQAQREENFMEAGIADVWEGHIVNTALPPLTLDEMVELENFIDRIAGDYGMPFDALDGFFSALIAGPRAVPPRDYLRVVFGGKMDKLSELSAPEETGKAKHAMKRHLNTIAAEMASGKPHMPIIAEGQDGELQANAWAAGFMHGVALAGDVWSRWINDPLEKDAITQLLSPVLMLAHEHDPNIKTRTPAIKGRKKRDKLVGMMTISALALYHVFRPHLDGWEDLNASGLLADDEPVHRGPKVGRNDPCPCGSKKKYKKCCGR